MSINVTRFRAKKLIHLIVLFLCYEYINDIEDQNMLICSIMSLFPMKRKKAINKADKNLNISGHQMQLSYIPLSIQKSNFSFRNVNFIYWTLRIKFRVVHGIKIVISS